MKGGQRQLLKMVTRNIGHFSQKWMIPHMPRKERKKKIKRNVNVYA